MFPEGRINGSGNSRVRDGWILALMFDSLGKFVRLIPSTSGSVLVTKVVGFSSENIVMIPLNPQPSSGLYFFFFYFYFFGFSYH